MKKIIFYINDCVYYNKFIKIHCNDYHNILLQSDHAYIRQTDADLTYDEVIIFKQDSSIEDLIEFVSELSSEMDIHAFITSDEFSMETAAHLREHFNIEGINLKQAAIVRDKAVMKRVMTEHNIRCAHSVQVNSIEDVNNNIETIGFPFVLKPLSGAGTIDTIKIENVEQLISSKFSFNNYLMEEYIYGDEFHVDSIVMDGEVKFASIAKYLVPNLLDSLQNHDTIFGSIVIPAKYYTNGLLSEMLNLNEKVIAATTIRNSVFHAEFYVTDYGEIIFGEIAARVGGGPRISPSIFSTHGINIFEYVIKTGIKNNNIKVTNTDYFTGWTNFKNSPGKILEISTIEEFETRPDFVESVILRKVGDVASSFNNTTIRTGHITLKNLDYNLLISSLTKVFNEFCIITATE